MLVVEQVADLWRNCPDVDAVHVMCDFERKGTRLARAEQMWRLLQLTARLRGRYDLVLCLHARSWFFAGLAYLTAARYRAGYIEQYPRRWLTHYAVPSDGMVSFREENRCVLRAIGIDVIDRRLRMWPTDEAGQQATRLLGGEHGDTSPLVALHPGSHWACQRWHNDRWSHVANTLVERYGARVVITGSADERYLAEEIARGMNTRPIIATGETSLLGFAEIIRRCSLLICVNSAASQVGLAIETPVVNLVGLEPLTWTEPEAGEAMAVVRECSTGSTSWCPLGVWGRLSQCQVTDHVGLAGLDAIHPQHVVIAAARWLRPFAAAEEIGNQLPSERRKVS